MIISIKLRTYKITKTSIKNKKITDYLNERKGPLGKTYCEVTIKRVVNNIKVITKNEAIPQYLIK